MTTKGTADIIFCIDASDSMQPCFDGLRKHIGTFASGLASSGQTNWDLRLDYVAHHASEENEQSVFRHSSLFNGELMEPLYRKTPQTGKFFTADVEEFKRGLNSVELSGNEAPLVALDFCLDFPWRDAANCHRAIVLMTDEAFETGAAMTLQKSRLRDLIGKIMSLKVMLYIVAPQSAVFDELSSVDRCEYIPVDDSGSGLAKVDFAELLAYIGKSVSQSSPMQTPLLSVKRGLYGQENWTQTQRGLTGK